MTDQTTNERKVRRWLLFYRVGFAAIILGPVAAWLYDKSMVDNPAQIHWHYRQSLNEYGERLAMGDVRFVENRGYAIPQFLIDHGATITSKKGQCYIVWFSSMLDNPTPALIYCSNGFDPLPPELENMVREPKSKWRKLSDKWSECQWPWWVND